ncbi:MULTISPECIES: hypothetical protein [Neisseria]|uniref:hypothetical protein n=1 Tax=Neisseria TaxID=482 RepID=UPI000A9B5227|nr:MULTISPECIES: hypothetical protein [Neisseria]MCL9764786.1 hypothetical protein [Neisseria subflava]
MMPMLNNQVRSVGFAHEANSSDDRLIQAAVSRGQSPRYGLQKTEMVGRILESDLPLKSQIFNLSDDPKP